MFNTKPNTILTATLLVWSLQGCSNTDATNPKTLEPSWTQAFNMPTLLAEMPVLSDLGDVQELLDQAWYAAIDIQHAANPEVTSLNTCNDYFFNKTTELRALRGYEQSAFAELQMACEAIRLLLNAEASSESFLSATMLDENTPQ